MSSSKVFQNKNQMNTTFGSLLKETEKSLLYYILFIGNFQANMRNIIASFNMHFEIRKVSRMQATILYDTLK